MAQVDAVLTSPVAKWRKQSKNEDVAVPSAGNTTLLEMTNLEMTDHVRVSIAPVTNALDAFRVSVKFHPDEAYILIASATGDYTSPAGLMLAASGDLTALAAAAIGWFLLDTRGVCAMLVEASAAAAGASSVSTYAAAS